MYSCIPPQIIRGQIHNISDYPNFHGDAKPSERCCILASQEFFSKQKVQIPKCFVCDENIFCKLLRSSRKNMHFIFIDIDCHHRCHVIFKKMIKICIVIQSINTVTKNENSWSGTSPKWRITMRGEWIIILSPIFDDILQALVNVTPIDRAMMIDTAT